MSAESKPLELIEHAGGRVLEVQVTGKLTKADYELFVPKVETLIKQHGKIRILLQMHDFHGWTPGAMWEDLKFDVHHFKDIERVALVGDKRWEQGMAIVCKPFTTASVRYFDRNDAMQAMLWLEQDVAAR